MNPLIFSLYKHPLTDLISNQLKFKKGNLTYSHFPDEETYLKIESPVKGRDIIIIDSLNHPDRKIIPILFFAKTAKELGAKRIGLVAPYLAYLRQDKCFQPGEGITSRYFSELLSYYFDWLLTVDPHLHRYNDLNEIYSIPNKVIHSAPAISQWITSNVKKPLLIGPDLESKQWITNLGKQIGAPYLILEKTRYGDKMVKIKVPNLSQYQKYKPVLIDDIISTGQTALETIKHLKNANMLSPICIGIHAIFSGKSYQKLLNTQLDRVLTCNTVPHSSNQIDISKLISQSLPAAL